MLLSISPKKPTAITLSVLLASRLTTAGAGARLSKWISLMRLHTSSPSWSLWANQRMKTPELTNESPARTWLLILTHSHLWWWGQPCPAPGSDDPQTQTYRRSGVNTTYKFTILTTFNMNSKKIEKNIVVLQFHATAFIGCYLQQSKLQDNRRDLDNFFAIVCSDRSSSSLSGIANVRVSSHQRMCLLEIAPHRKCSSESHVKKKLNWNFVLFCESWPNLTIFLT